MSRTCYSPDTAVLRVGGTKPEPRSVGARNSTDTGGSETVAEGPGQHGEPSSDVKLCLCFKAQAVVRSVGWWQVLLDSSSLAGGRCKFWLAQRAEGAGHGYSGRNIQFSTTTVSTESFLGIDSSFEGFEASTAAAPEEEGSVPVKELLSRYLYDTWKFRRGECDHVDIARLRVCFSSTKYSVVEPACFSLQEPAQVFNMSSLSLQEPAQVFNMSSLSCLLRATTSTHSSCSSALPLPSPGVFFLVK